MILKEDFRKERSGLVVCEKMITPKADGFRMPGEFERHHGCLMIWPVRPGSWPFGAAAAQKAFAQVAGIIAGSEMVYMLAGKEHMEQAKNMLPEKIQLVEIETDDAWARHGADLCSEWYRESAGCGLAV